MLNYIIHYTTLHYITPYYRILHYITLHYTILHYITLYYTTLRCVALHCIVLWDEVWLAISGSLIWSKTLMELILTCGEFLWSPEDPVRQIHFPRPHVAVPGMFSDILSSVHILKGEWDAESNGKLPQLFIPGKTAALVHEFAVEDLPRQNRSPGSILEQNNDYIQGETELLLVCYFVHRSWVT